MAKDATEKRGPSSVSIANLSVWCRCQIVRLKSFIPVVDATAVRPVRIEMVVISGHATTKGGRAVWYVYRCYKNPGGLQRSTSVLERGNGHTVGG